MHVLFLVAQLFISTGVQNTGKLTDEVTHTVRTPSLPGHVYADLFFKHKSLGAHGAFAPTRLIVNNCNGPCNYNRFNLRPENVEEEHDLYYWEAGIGYTRGPAYVGLCALVIDGGYAAYGATPMTRYGVCARAVWANPIGASCGLAWSPAQKPGWTALAEKSGAKRVGEPHSVRQNVLVVRCGGALKIR